MASSILEEQDMERGQQLSFQWVSKVEHKLLILKEELQNELDGSQIFKVPEHHRQPTVEFTPVGWRFGLHNRENLDMTTGSEALKLALLVLYGLEEQSKLIDFCDAVVPDPVTMLTCYGLHKGVTDLMKDEIIKQVLAFDALFLAVYTEIYGMASNSPDMQRLWLDEVVISEETRNSFFYYMCRWTDVVGLDLCRIENQIPFVLIKRAIKHVKRLTDPLYEDEDHPVGSDTNGGQVHEPSPLQPTQLPAKEGIVERVITYIKKFRKPLDENEDHPISDAKVGQVPDPYLEIWMKAAVRSGIGSFMDTSDDFYKDANAHPRLSQSHHILDAAYKTICGVNGMQRTSDYSQTDYIHIPPATRLKNSGIKIVGVVGPLCTMSYNKEKKCLSLPKIQMFDETVATIRNIGRYEQYSEGYKCMFHDYVNLMLDLIETPSDLKHLIKCGVIRNQCGNKALDMWSALEQGLTGILSSKEHNEMKKDINTRCKLKQYRLWSEFMTLFFSRPWLTLSTIAVVVVTLATLLQTYTSIIGSNRMKPQF